MNKTCKDCIHFEVCDYHITEMTHMTVNECSHGFKDKSRYIELPCAVGDAIFRICDKEVYDWWLIEHIEIYEDEVLFIDDSDNKFTANDIGKTVFLTKEDAEKVLKGGAE